MKRLIIGVALLAAVLLPATSLAQTVYRWVDKDGKVHFSDAPPQEEAKDLKQQRVGSGGSDDVPLPYATQMAMKKSPVKLFVGNQCGDYCANARALLSRRGVPYSELNAEVSKDAADELMKVAGALSVPTLLVGEQAVKGFTEESWNAA